MDRSLPHQLRHLSDWPSLQTVDQHRSCCRYTGEKSSACASQEQYDALRHIPPLPDRLCSHTYRQACPSGIDQLQLLWFKFYLFHACPSPLSRLRGFFYRIFDCYSLLLCKKADQYFHDLFDIHMHHLSNLYALLIVRVSGIWYNLPSK